MVKFSLLIYLSRELLFGALRIIIYIRVLMFTISRSFALLRNATQRVVLRDNLNQAYNSFYQLKTMFSSCINWKNRLKANNYIIAMMG